MKHKKTKFPPIVLASGSQWRLKLLNDSGILATGEAACIDEHSILGVDPIDTALHRAIAKAEAVAKDHSKSLVIGADQVVYIDELLFEKPISEKQWFERLCFLRGKSHLLSTAVVILLDGEQQSFVETTMVNFRSDISNDEIRSYISHGEAWGCAGGYMMEGHGAWMIESIEGDWQNVIGLPIFPLISQLKRLGYSYPLYASSEQPITGQ